MELEETIVIEQPAADDEPAAEDELLNCWENEPEELQQPLRMVDGLCRRDAAFPVQQCLDYLCHQLRPQSLTVPLRQRFISRLLKRGLVGRVAEVMESSAEQGAVGAVNLLACLAFGSAKGAEAVLEILEDVARCFGHVFESFDESKVQLLDVGIALSANLAALCPRCHGQLLPMVRPVILQAVTRNQAGEDLLGHTVLLLANLSLTLSSELQQLGVAEALLDVVKRDLPGRSVAESVVVYLHDGRRCSEVDTLIEMGFVPGYCVPLLEATLVGADFRGMFPYLSYTARLFWLLSKCRAYAEKLVEDPKVVPLLLQACEPRAELGRMDSGDIEGRRLAFVTLRQLAAMRLWPEAPMSTETREFFQDVIPRSLRDDDAGVRAAAAYVWGQLHVDDVVGLLMVCHRMEKSIGPLPPAFWREKILSYVFPFLSQYDM